MRSRSRLEQLVAVHRQLLRKYAALELDNSEGKKKISLRDERIKQLELNSRALATNMRSQAERHVAELTKLREQVSLLREEQQQQQMEARLEAATSSARAPGGVRTVRGGGGDPTAPRSISGGGGGWGCRWEIALRQRQRRRADSAPGLFLACREQPQRAAAFFAGCSTSSESRAAPATGAGWGRRPYEPYRRRGGHDHSLPDPHPGAG